MEGTTTPKRRRTGRWTLVSGIALIAVGVLSFNAYANFTGTTSYNQSVSTGTLSLTKANEDSATKAYNLAGADLAPGDTMQRGLKLSVSGSISASDLTVSAADGTPTELDNGTGVDMQLRIDVCDQAYDETVNSNIPTYNCAGSEQEVLDDTDLGDLIATPATLANINLAGANHLMLTWTLPSGADNTFQGLTNTVSLTFSANQRAPQAK
jgi:hypothetical protein